MITFDHFIGLHVGNDQIIGMIPVHYSDLTQWDYVPMSPWILAYLHTEYSTWGSQLSCPMLQIARSKSLGMETFADNFLTALEKDDVDDRLKLLLKSVVQEVMEPNTRRREQSLKYMESVVSTRGRNSKLATTRSSHWRGRSPVSTAPLATSSNMAVEVKWNFSGSRERDPEALLTTKPCTTFVWSSDLSYLLRTC